MSPTPRRDKPIDATVYPTARFKGVSAMVVPVARAPAQRISQRMWMAWGVLSAKVHPRLSCST